MQAAEQELEPDLPPDPVDAIRHPAKKRFLLAYAKTGNVTLAAESAKLHRTTHYVWLGEDPAYAAAARLAQEEANERLEAEARRRAEEGVRRPVLYQGQQVQIKNPRTGEMEPLWEHAYSDTLMVTLLKANLPDKYAERSKVDQTTQASVSVSGGDGVPDWFRGRTDEVSASSAGHDPQAG